MSSSTKKLTGLALLTAIVVVLQYLGSFVHIGPFAVSLVLIPIVVGAAVFGPGAGAYLGGVFSAVVIIASVTGADQGGALYWNANPLGMVLVVAIKGIAAGWCAGVVYRALEEKNETLATVLAAIVCPVVNTGLFLLGSFTVVRGLLEQMAGGSDLILFAMTGLVGINFIAELVTNLVLSPVIVRILHAVSVRSR